ncbi:hypothetical protein D3C81_1950950 [compost metagenome]
MKTSTQAATTINLGRDSRRKKHLKVKPPLRWAKLVTVRFNLLQTTSHRRTQRVMLQTTKLRTTTLRRMAQ